MNVSLNSGFEGGEIYFGSMVGETLAVGNYDEYKHVINHGILHRGQHQHGTLPIEDGEREADNPTYRY